MTTRSFEDSDYDLEHDHDHDFDQETMDSDYEDEDKKNILDAVEALGKLKNSSASSITSNSPPPSSTGSQTSDDSQFQQRFLSKVSTYYKTSKDYSPTFKVGAEYVEKKAIPIVKKLESKYIRKNSELQKKMNYLQVQQHKLQNFNLNMSIESKKNLSLVLKMLRLANARLKQGVDNLQNIVVEKEKRLINGKHQQRVNSNEKLQQAKKDIVITVKKAVLLISKVAGNSLSEPSRSSVRQVLLKLPEKLSIALNTTPPGSPRPSGINGDLRDEQQISSSNNKILLLAKESLDSFANIINIFDTNLNKMDNWVEINKRKELERLRNIKDENYKRVS